MEDLEKLIQNERGAFDDAEPNTGHTRRFEDKLDRMTGGRSRSRFPFGWAAAAVIAIVLVSQIQFKDNTPQDAPQYAGLSLSDISPELGEVESFYQSQLEVATSGLEEGNQPQAAHHELLQKQLEELDRSFEELKIELQKNHSDQRVINSMIQNYRLRLELIQRHIEFIELLNSTNHENQSL